MKNETTPIIREIYEQYFNFIKSKGTPPTVLELGVLTKDEFIRELGPIELSMMLFIGKNKFRGMVIEEYPDEHHIKVK